jgi:hypothetical protein
MSSIEVTKQPNRYVTVTKKQIVSTVTVPEEKVIEVHDPGVAGPPNVLTVGSVEVADGAQASVTITGVAPNQVINFIIPSAAYVHSQISSSSTWTITHNLGYFPSVTVVDSSNNVVVGDVKYISDNVVTVSFNATFGGKAYLS